jgi:hypothetical protein
MKLFLYFPTIYTIIILNYENTNFKTYSELQLVEWTLHDLIYISYEVNSEIYLPSVDLMEVDLTDVTLM